MEVDEVYDGVSDNGDEAKVRLHIILLFWEHPFIDKNHFSRWAGTTLQEVGTLR